MLLDNHYLADVRQEIYNYDTARRKTVSQSDQIRSNSKRAIFALHRNDLATAEKLLSDAEQDISLILDKSKIGSRSLEDESSFKSALEEYAEAYLYHCYVRGEVLGRVMVKDFEFPADVFLGGLCDLVGELQRRQVRLATNGDVEGVKAIRDLAEEIIKELVEMDLTGYLRNKFDQAKNSFRRVEDVLYEISIRRT